MSAEGKGKWMKGEGKNKNIRDQLRQPW